MKHVNRIATSLGLLALPLIAVAHPGHDGDQTHGLAGVIVLAATFVTLKRVLVVVKSRRGRNIVR